MPNPTLLVARERRDEADLFRRHDSKLRATVRREVRTSPANIEDACAFAWLQLVRRRPRREAALAWLVRTGCRESVTLGTRDRRAVHLDCEEAVSVRDVRLETDRRLEL